METRSHAPTEHAPLGARLVLLHDARWPQVPGVCCWRYGVGVAFARAGATVEEVVWQPPPPPAGLARQAPRARPWLARFPPPIRRPVARMGGGLRRGIRRMTRMDMSVRQGQRLPLDLDRARLVICESIDAAAAAIASGVSRQRVWALALPHDRLHAGEPTGFAAEVARAADKLGGLLTDSELARDSLERATAASRTPVEVFPPLAVDRPCPEHSCARVTADNGWRESGSHPPAQPEGEIHPAAAQLALWRRMIDLSGEAGSVDTPYSFAAARLYRAGARWRPSSRPAWSAVSDHRHSVDRPDPSPASLDLAGWSAEGQDRAALRLWASATPRSPRRPRRSRAALVGGFDLKFARELAERLDHRTDLDVVVDEWLSLSQGTRFTEGRLRHAESIFAEWARTSAVWYSRHKRPDQFLAVRLHRFELDAPYPRDIAVENVDAMVYIAPLFGRRIRDELGWPVDRLVYIPNFLDLDWLDRPKLPDARFAIGFVGIEWSRKRFDLALDLLARLRHEDRRFTLVVRSTMPWHNRYAWADPAEREFVGQCLERVEQDPWLRHSVIFDEPGRDMARWFRRIGHILSTSDEEGCHTSVAEGMASGAVAIVRPWPGAAEIYGREWLHQTIEEAADAVLTGTDPDVWAEQGARAKAEIRQTHNPEAVVDAWADLLHGEVECARAHFVRYSQLSGSSAAESSVLTPSPRSPSTSVAGRPADR